MNIRTTSSHSDSGTIRWIDIVDPGINDLKTIAAEYGILDSSLQDCLEPYHLPKFEKHTHYTFIILRMIDPHHPQGAFDVTDLTRKIAIFIGSDYILTIHRSKITFIDHLQTSIENNPASGAKFNFGKVLNSILNQVIGSYDPLIDQSLEYINSIEQESKSILKKVFRIKKQASTIKRLLRLTHEVCVKLAADIDPQFKTNVNDVKEDLENTIYFAEDLNEGIHHYLSLHLSMQSQRTNETMRIMAIFSAFFLPITFIVGLYGMNFKNMPELDWSYGYAFSLLLMLGSSIAVFIWFKRNRWL
jgi:magnesium transporter